MQRENAREQKFLYILLAILVAAAMWFYVDEFGDNGGAEVTITDIPISYTGESGLADRGLMLLEEQTSASVDLTVEGGRRLVSSLVREDIRVTVSLANVNRSGVQTVDYDVYFPDRRFSEDMIQERSINRATVNISELNSKTVEIRCELVGNLAEGCSAGQLQLSQETLEIRGLAEDIDPVDYVKVTLDIGASAAETVSQALSFQYYDINNQLLASENIHPTVETVQATLPVFITKDLRLDVEFKEAPGVRRRNLDYDIRPSTITVSGDASVLRDVDVIYLGQMDLLELRQSGASSHTYSIIVPEGCQNLSGVTRATMEIAFKDMTGTQVLVEEISYTNMPGGKDIELLTGTLLVTVYGTSEDVAAVTGENISVTADLANYSAASGTYTVPVTVTVTAPVDVGISGSYQVQVSIREPSEDTEARPESPEPEEGNHQGPQEE